MFQYVSSEEIDRSIYIVDISEQVYFISIQDTIDFSKNDVAIYVKKQSL